MATTQEVKTEGILHLEKAQFHVDLCSSCQKDLRSLHMHQEQIVYLSRQD